jgi:hypothetical protein
MITRQQVEAYADELIELTEVDLAKITLEDAVLQVADLLAPLSPRERDAVIKCADEIRTMEAVARAAGCPADVPYWPWLIERGLIFKKNRRWHIRKPGPRGTIDT